MENENQNMETEQEQGRFSTPPQQEQSPFNVAPQQYRQTVPLPGKPAKHMSLGVASVVLGGISLLCCWMYGINLIPALIGAILGLIALIKGEGKARILGGVGFGLSVVGLILGVIMVITYASMINWDNVTIENIMSIEDVNPEDQDEVIRWMQQFFNIDLTRY